MSSNIVVVGSTNTDMIVKGPKLPRSGETVAGGLFSTAAGGKGANQAVAAARAGGAVVFVTCVGSDALGGRAVQGFIEEEINTDYVSRVQDVPSGVALIFVEDGGENSIAVAPGANAELCPAHVKKAERAIASVDVLVAQLEVPIETVQTAVEMASAYGVRVILNPAPAQLLENSMLRHVSVLTPNESEVELLTGIDVKSEAQLESAADELLRRGASAVLITLGARGAHLATAEVHKRIRGIEVEAIDTTAAGDVFNGALAAALSKGKGLVEAARYANAAAALSTTKLGAQTSVPRRKKILRLLGRTRNA